MANMKVEIYGDLAASADKTTSVDLAKREGHIGMQGFPNSAFIEFEFTDNHVDQKLEIVGLTLTADLIPQRSR